MKTKLDKAYDGEGVALAEETLGCIDEQRPVENDVLDRFDALMKSVDEQLDACDAPEPTLEDIVLA